ncbi:MAG: hypothetical protein ACRC62_14855 [Microcoleus sp.]
MRYRKIAGRDKGTAPTNRSGGHSWHRPYLSIINYQLSTINYQSIASSRRSYYNSQLFTAFANKGKPNFSRCSK